MSKSSSSSSAKTVAPAAVATITVLEFPADKKAFREGTARFNWYAALQEFNGKPLADFVAHVTATPPSLQPNGKFGKAELVEPPMGWVRWFVRNGFVKVESK